MRGLRYKISGFDALFGIYSMGNGLMRWDNHWLKMTLQMDEGRLITILDGVITRWLTDQEYCKYLEDTGNE